MKQHLSSEQISKCLAGDATPEETSHLQECNTCSADLARLDSAVSSFRETVREWSDQTSNMARQPLPDPRPGRPALIQVLRWGAVAAIVIVMAGFPMWRLKQQRADLANQDEVLLEQIASGLSRSVAQPMQPLTKLWTTNGSTGQDQYR
jgi:anti-sigma factor RsiW